MDEGGSANERRQDRSHSLRREWTRAFVLMLASVLVTGVGTVVGVWQLVGQFSGVAEQRDHETSIVLALRTSIIDHEQAGHQILSGKTVDRSTYLSQQSDVAATFTRAIAIFPATNGTRQILRGAETSWQEGLTDAGLWGQHARTITGLHLEENPIYGAASDAVGGQLNDLEGPSLRAMHDGLASGERLEREMIILLVAMFGLAIGVTWHFRRKMSRELLGPVASMRHSAVKLRAGDLDHQIPITRHDELGELAAAFNSMAEALRDSHRALTRRATSDAMTGLANRTALTEHLTATFDAEVDRPATRTSLLFIDVDDFKDVNDTLGHEAGDTLLIQLVGRLASCVGPDDLVGRLGGDEFAIVVAERDARHRGSEVAEKILTALEPAFVINGIQLNVSVSIGVAERHPDTADPADLLRQADFAMYMAKGAGKSRCQVFDALMHDNMLGRTALQADLANAVGHHQLRLDYQPVTDLTTGRIVGVEALVRWQHPAFGILPPDDFIPLAEETGDIEAIGCWVLETAVHEVATWRRTIPDQQDLWVSVNLSAFQLPSPHSLAAIEHILADPGAQARSVVLEVTETALSVNLESGIASLHTLKNTGARIAIDDFGTGFSLLGTMTSLPVDILKIDRSFISGHNASPAPQPILEGIIDLGHKLRLDVIAEGIEQPEQLDLLRHLGCQLGQGYLLARPTPPEATADLLASGVLLHPATTTTANTPPHIATPPANNNSTQPATTT